MKNIQDITATKLLVDCDTILRTGSLLKAEKEKKMVMKGKKQIHVSKKNIYIYV